MLLFNSIFLKATGALALHVSALSAVLAVTQQPSNDVCYYTESSKWTYVDSAYQPRDPRFPVTVPPAFSQPKTFVLSTVRADDSVSSFRWKSLPPDSVLLWNTFVMEGFAFRGTIRGDTLSAELTYMHDSFPDRRAQLRGTRIDCPKDRRGVTTAFLASDKS